MEVILGSIVFVALYGIFTVGFTKTHEGMHEVADLTDSVVDSYITKCEKRIAKRDSNG